MEYNATENCITIFNSYKIEKRFFEGLLNAIAAANPDCNVPKERSMFSMKMEWTTHNFLYNIHVARSRTKDVDINIPMRWYLRFAYCVCGILSWLFIK